MIGINGNADHSFRFSRLFDNSRSSALRSSSSRDGTNSLASGFLSISMPDFPLPPPVAQLPILLQQPTRLVHPHLQIIIEPKQDQPQTGICTSSSLGCSASSSRAGSAEGRSPARIRCICSAACLAGIKVFLQDLEDVYPYA